MKLSEVQCSNNLVTLIKKYLHNGNGYRAVTIHLHENKNSNSKGEIKTDQTMI